jgi:asparagine synthase (glutamine-hydrolysing)
MCGIWACFHNTKEVPNDAGIYHLKKRGPDEMSILILKNIVFGFSHLKINGDTPQPLRHGRWTILCNGEIFNHVELEKRLGITPPPGSSDCWILPYLFNEYGFKDVYSLLDGEFAIVAYDSQENTVYLYRDTYGIKPLFIGRTETSYHVGSEIKSLAECDSVEWVRPGACTIINTSVSYIEYMMLSHNLRNTLFTDFGPKVRSLLENAVKKRRMSDRPIGALLSGGLDSSIICSILAKMGPLHTFSIGIEGSPDLKYAKIVAEHIGSSHHEIIHTAETFQESVIQVIYNIESYDVTTVRASVGNWLVGKYIAENTDIKVVFNGDGSDELFGGYLYFHHAPSDVAFKKETERLLRDIHMFDVLRSERSMSSHGLESRTPFLDPELTVFVSSIPTTFLRPVCGVEKKLLREIFINDLPSEIINRQKEAFSDGVNSGIPWFKRDDEEDFYKLVFNMFYLGKDIIPYKWMPKWINATDPSAKIYMNEGS